MARFTTEQETDIVRRYTAGESLRKIAMEMRTSDGQIKGMLARAGIALRPAKLGASPLSETQREEITYRLAAGQSQSFIARAMRIRYERLVSWLDAAGIDRRKPNATKFDPATEERIAKRYAAKESTRTLAAEYGVTVSTIREIARRQGITVNPRGNNAREFPCDDVSEMANLWRSGVSQEEIGRRYGASQIVISRVLSQSGITKEQRKRSGERSNLWKGGRINHPAGYIQLLIPDDHRFASMRNGTGYVMEHRLVMAETLNRPLSSRETVHHINGIRSDNRIENLQLMSGTHAKGAAMCCAECGSRNIIACNVEAKL